MAGIIDLTKPDEISVKFNSEYLDITELIDDSESEYDYLSKKIVLRGEVKKLVYDDINFGKIT